MSNPPSTFSQKDELISLIVFDTPFIPSDFEFKNPFVIIKFSPLSFSKITRKFNTQEKKEISDDPSKRDDKADAILDPKINHFSDKKQDPNIGASKDKVLNETLPVADQLVPSDQVLDSSSKISSPDITQ